MQNYSDKCRYHHNKERGERDRQQTHTPRDRKGKEGRNKSGFLPWWLRLLGRREISNAKKEEKMKSEGLFIFVFVFVLFFWVHPPTPLYFHPFFPPFFFKTKKKKTKSESKKQHRHRDRERHNDVPEDTPSIPAWSSCPHSPRQIPQQTRSPCSHWHETDASRRANCKWEAPDVMG